MTDLDMESLARALWDHEEAQDAEYAEARGDRPSPLGPWEDQPPHFQEEFHAKAEVVCQDIKRQGFLIVRLEGRVNDGEKPQGAA